MRQPTPINVLFQWWQGALAGRASFHDADPQCGYYKRRMTKGGPWVPVRIWCERDIDPETGELVAPERLICECEGRRVDPAPIWTYLTPITRTEYEALVKECARNPTMAATMARVDLTERAMRP